jgi:tape measure domain-containing protein
VAESEVYRVEIPIIVDDQTEPSLQQAERKITRFEKSAQKTNKRLRRMFGREIRLRIGAIDKAWPVIKGIQTRLRGLTSRAWKITLQAKDKVTGTIKSIFRTLTSPLALLGAGAGATAAIAYPLKLAGEMEQARIAMDYFTGSVQRGQKFLERLQAFAAKTPFEFPDVREAAVGLMPLYKNMYGVDKAMDETIRTIRAFGDAAGYTGAGIQGMNLALLGFRQIGTMGKLGMEELRQVTENLLIPMDIVLKELGLTGDALEDLGKRGIPAKTAMEAIVRALEKNFAGGMEKMSRSLLGLVSTVKDTANLTVTAFGAGMAEPVRRILLDLVGITDYTGAKYKTFQAKLQDAGRRVGEYFERVYKKVKQFWSELSADPEFQKMDFGDKIIYIINLALDKISTWLDSEGGMKLQTIFAKIGEIAAKAWLAGLKGAVKGMTSSAASGNILGAGAMLGLASALGGGLVLRGAIGAGKGVYRAGKGVYRAGKWVFSKIKPATTAKAVEKVAETASVAAKGASGKLGFLSQIKSPTVLGKAGKFLGKIALPLAIVTETIDIIRAQDKTKALLQGVGGIGGGFAGAKLGAAIGTAIAPGIGTAIGGAIGGLGGYLTGRFAAGKTVDTARGGAKYINAPVAVKPTTQKITIEVHAESKPTYNIKTAVNADDVLRIIRTNEKTIADQLADDISRKLVASFNNMPLVFEARG